MIEMLYFLTAEKHGLTIRGVMIILFYLIKHEGDTH